MTKEELLEQYHEKGGTYAMPVEVMNDFIEDYKEVEQENAILKSKLEAYETNLCGNIDAEELQREKENLIKYLEDELKRENPIELHTQYKVISLCEILEKVKSGKYE